MCIMHETCSKNIVKTKPLLQEKKNINLKADLLKVLHAVSGGRSSSGISYHIFRLLKTIQIHSPDSRSIPINVYQE